MADSDPSELRGQAIAVGLDQMPDGSLAGAVRFADSSAELFPVTQLTSQTRGSLKSQVSGFVADGRTDYQAAFEAAQGQLAQMNTAARKAVIFLSDGVPNPEEFDSDRPIANAGTPIYTIGFGDADQSVLAGIAARSGGQTFRAGSADDLQSIFARIVAALTCSAPNVTTAVDLGPGEARVVPFSVGVDDGEFRALAAWSGGGVTVTAERPDASTMSPGSLRLGERFSDNPTYALLSGTDPAVGPWQLRVAANGANAGTIHVSIDVFKKGLPPLPDPPPLDVHTQGRHRDPCLAAYPGGQSTMKKIFGGSETRYDRVLSQYLVCGGFGTPEDLELTLGMKCALVSAATIVAGGATAPASLVAFDQICSGTDTLTELASGNWAGVAADKSCAFFGDLFAEAIGLIAAGATIETGPGAAVIGDRVYRAFAAGFRIACGGLFAGGAQSVGIKLEADHEARIARDIMVGGKCLRHTQRLGLLSWSAASC